MHHVGRLDAASMSTPDAYRGRSLGFRRQSLIDGHVGSVHMGFGVCQLAPQGQIQGHVHSFEEAFYVLEGHPRLTMGGETFELGPHQCGLIPLGTPHAWGNAGAHACRWLDMLAPRPRDPGAQPPDTFFTPQPASANGARPLDIRDPRRLPLSIASRIA